MSNGREDRGDDRGRDYSRRTSGILNDPRLRRGIEYIQGEEFKEDRRRFQREAGERLKNIRERYRGRERTPEEAARERELSLRLAEVEAESAEVRLRLSELLEEERKLRSEMESF